MPLVGFNLGGTGEGTVGKSLDDIIEVRRKEQAKASSGRGSNSRGGGKNSNNNNNNRTPTKRQQQQKEKLADRSIATNRAKRAAAVKAKRGLSASKKPTPLEVQRENYRQSRKSSETKKRQEQKSSKGKLPSNSSLRNGKGGTKGKNNKNNNKSAGSTNAAPVLFGRMPSKKQMKAATDGMKDANCPIPAGHQLIMQFVPLVLTEQSTNSNKDKSNNNSRQQQKQRNGGGNNNNQKGGRGRVHRGRK